MKMFLQKTARGLLGITEADHRAWLKFKQLIERLETGAHLKIEYARPRNPGHHRKFFALLQLIADNSEVYDTPEKALVALKLVTGYADPIIHPSTGEVQLIPRSISYEGMDQTEFDEFYNRAIDGVLQHILPDMPRQKFDRLLEIVISGWA